MNIAVNYWSVIASAISGMIIGSIWYGPLFGRKYMNAMGMDSWSPEQREKMKKSMFSSYALQFVASALTYFVLAWIMAGLNKLTVSGGLETGFWIWLGFIVPIKLSDILWGGKKVLFWLGIGGNLISLLAAGAIIGAW